MFKRLRNPAVPPATEQRAALLAGQHITYTLKRSGKRRSIGLRIDDRGLTVSMPLRASETWLHSVLQDKADWVVEKLDGWQMRKPVETHWRDGETIAYLGELLTLRVVRSLFAAPVQCRGSALWVFVTHGHGKDSTTRHARAPLPNPLPLAGEGANESLGELDFGDDDAAQIERAVSFWYRQEALQLYQQRVAHYAPLLDAAPRMVRLSTAKTQWGCCTARGTVRLNLQLVKLPLRLIDYVVVHELAHLREMNHSAAFWRVVGSVCPDYLRLRSELKAVAL